MKVCYVILFCLTFVSVGGCEHHSESFSPPVRYEELCDGTQNITLSFQSTNLYTQSPDEAFTTQTGFNILLLDGQCRLLIKDARWLNTNSEVASPGISPFVPVRQLTLSEGEFEAFRDSIALDSWRRLQQPLDGVPPSHSHPAHQDYTFLGSTYSCDGCEEVSDINQAIKRTITAYYERAQEVDGSLWTQPLYQMSDYSSTLYRQSVARGDRVLLPMDPLVYTYFSDNALIITTRAPCHTENLRLPEDISQVLREQWKTSLLLPQLHGTYELVFEREGETALYGLYLRDNIAPHEDETSGVPLPPLSYQPPCR